VHSKSAGELISYDCTFWLIFGLIQTLGVSERLIQQVKWRNVTGKQNSCSKIHKTFRIDGQQFC